MIAKYLSTTNKRTGEEFCVIEYSPRRRYFGLVPKSHPAQNPIKCDRREFTKPVWKEVS